MKKLLFTLTLLICLSSFGQIELRPNPFLKGKIILKDGSIKNGGIRLNNSVFSIRFKDSVRQKKSEKVDYKTIEKIVINLDSLNSREFYYKKTTRNKFKVFVELLQSGNIDLYKDLTKNYNHFYDGIDRKTTSEAMNDLRYEDPDIPLLKNPQTVELNGQKFTLPTLQRNSTQFISVEIELPVYLFHKKNTEKLIFLDSKKNLKKLLMNILATVQILSKKLKLKNLENVML